jgi:hypothetical protein
MAVLMDRHPVLTILGRIANDAQHRQEHSQLQLQQKYALSSDAI